MAKILFRACNRKRFTFLKSYMSTAQSTRSITEINDKEFTLKYLEGEHEGIAVAAFNRPDTRNAINKNIATQFQKALDAVRWNKQLRVMILRSANPGMFCAGADLKERAQMPAHEVGPFVGSLQKISTDLSDLPIPTIAAMDGAALGGGLELALCCDMRIAALNVKMGLVEARLAIIPGAGGTQRLARLLGPSKAKELIFGARILDGKHAYELGLVNDAVYQNDEGDQAYQAALDMAMHIIPNGPIALRMAKIAINKGLDVDLTTGLAIEQQCYAQVIPTKDRTEGLQAFKEKRKPKYIGE